MSLAADSDCRVQGNCRKCLIYCDYTVYADFKRSTAEIISVLGKPRFK